MQIILKNVYKKDLNLKYKYVKKLNNKLYVDESIRP